MFRQDVLWVLAAGMFAGVMGCSSEPEVPITPQPDAGPPPAPTPVPVVDAGPTCTPAPCDAHMQLAMQEAIKAREKAEVTFGMKPESTFSCQQVCEAGAVAVPVTLQPGFCYTFLGSSFPNVTQLDMVLKPNFGPNPPPILANFGVGAQSSESGPNASIGSGKTCYKWAFPIPGPALVEAKSRSGAGPIAVQVYAKRQ